MGPPDGELERKEFRIFEHHALGTWNVLRIDDPDPREPALTERAAAAAFRLLDRIEDELSRFRPESDLSLLNALGAGGPVPIGRSLFEILAISRAAWEETGGAFDPTVAPLLDAWGFPRGPARIPPEAEILALLERRGMDRVILDPAARTARFDRPGVALDLGGIGKGYAVDRVLKLLREKGVPSGVFSSGTSSIALWGRPPEGGSWRLQVTHPARPEEALGTLELEGGTISTSASYEERFFLDGVEYGHILDPRSGRPARSPVRSVTVWAPEAAQGDILSTALFVLDRSGREGLLRKIEARKGRIAALVVEEDPAAPGRLAASLCHAGEPGFRWSDLEALKEGP